MKKIYIILISLLLLSTSCILEKDVDFEADYEGDKIVVHGVFTPGFVELEIRRSMNPAENIVDNIIDNAIVEVYTGEKLICQLDNNLYGNYTSPEGVVFNQNTEYTVKISASGYEPVVSDIIIIPEKSEIVEAYTEKEREESRSGLLTYTFNDNEAVKNSYGKDIVLYLDGVTYGNYGPTESSFDFMSSFNHYNDDGFNGKLKYEVESIYFIYHEYETRTDKYFDSVRIIHYHLSNQMLEFLNSLNDYESTFGTIIDDIHFTITTNMSNKHGFIAAFNADTVYIKLKE